MTDAELKPFLDRQTAALRWLWTVGRVVVVALRPDGTPWPLWDMRLEHEWLSFDHETWILRTPEGRLLWARNGDDRNYRHAFAAFAKADGLDSWDSEEFHVDHLLSRKSHSRPYEGNVEQHLHVLALIPSKHNTDWSAFEKRNHRHNNVFDLWLVVKTLGCAPPLKQDGLEKWLKGSSAMAPILVEALNLKDVAPGQIGGPRTGPDFLAEGLLGRSIADGAAATEWVQAILLQEILENAYGAYPWRFPDQADAQKLAKRFNELLEQAAGLRGAGQPFFFESLIDVDLESGEVRGFVVEPIMGCAN